MNVLQNLMELYNHLPQDSTHRVVVKAILENLNALQDATIYDVAEVSNTSRTTVWSVVRKLGYQSYSEFRHALKNCVSQFNYYNRILKPDQALPQAAEGCEPYLHFCERNLRQTADWIAQLDPGIVDKCARRMHDFSRVSFYLPYRLASVPSFQQNLAMDGKMTGYFCLLPEMLEDAQQLNTQSLVIINTLEYAETLDVTPVFTAARQRGAEIWLLNGSNSKYCRMADWLLLDDAPKSQFVSAVDPFLQVLSEWYRALYLDSDCFGSKI